MKKNCAKQSRAFALTKVAALLLTTILLSVSAPAHAAEGKKVAVGTVNFKTCVELSKLGKQEQATFEAMKKQMESILEEKEKQLNEIAAKFNDPDYLDSLAPEAETEMKRKFRALSQELTQQQNQYYQTLQQANYKIILKISEVISKAASEVAAEKKLDIILNEEGSFYHAPDLDISTAVVAKMDVVFDKEAKEKPQETPVK